MLIYELTEWEEIAASDFSSVTQYSSAVESLNALARFKAEFKRLAKETNTRRWKDHEKDRRTLLNNSLKYRHVAFFPYHGLTRHWPDRVSVHQRKPGQNKTLCSKLFEPNDERYRDAPSEPYAVETSAHKFWTECRVCEMLGMEPRGEHILWVNKPRAWLKGSDIDAG
jgi:hypothetical protein